MTQFFAPQKIFKRFVIFQLPYKVLFFGLKNHNNHKVELKICKKSQICVWAVKSGIFFYSFEA